MNKDQSIEEINNVIKEVEKSLEPNCEIGARDKVTLTKLLSASGTAKKIKFFKCKREQSAKIVSFFVKQKGIPQNKFSSNVQEYVYLLY